MTKNRVIRWILSIAVLVATASALVMSRSRPEAAVAVETENGCVSVGLGLTPAGGGPPGSSGFANACCAGLMHVESKDVCGEPYGGYSGQCVPCGNGKCDAQFENSCNCPQDCN